MPTETEAAEPVGLINDPHGQAPMHGWRGSHERDITRSKACWFLAAATVVAAAGAGLILIILPFSKTVTLAAVGATISLCASFLTLLIGSAYYLKKRALFRESWEEGRERVFLQDPNPQFASLVRGNREQLERYDFLARNQAGSSYNYGVLAMLVGLATLITGAVVSIVVDNTTSKITTATLTAVSVALSGYIAQTFLKTYRWTLGQLNFYFEEPLVTSRLLTMERLAASLSRSKREEIHSRMIELVLESSIQNIGGSSSEAATEHAVSTAAQKFRFITPAISLKRRDDKRRSR